MTKLSKTTRLIRSWSPEDAGEYMRSANLNVQEILEVSKEHLEQAERSVQYCRDEVRDAEDYLVKCQERVLYWQKVADAAKDVE